MPRDGRDGQEKPAMTHPTRILPAPARPEAVAGMSLMIGAMLMAPGLDTIAKVLMDRLSPAQVGAGRFLAQTVVLLPVILLARQWGRPTRLHALAGLFLGFALLTLNLALRQMPVPNAIAIFFVEPLILTLLGAAVLGETLGWRRLTAVGVGLIGALIVLRPNVAAYGPAAVWPLATAALFACYMLTTRVMSQRGGRIALQFWTGAFAALALSLAAGVTAAVTPQGDVLLMPTGREFGLFALVGCGAAVVHGMIVGALSRIEAGVVAPFQYFEIISATLLGWLVFGDFPDRVTWAGTALIIAAGVYVFHRERRLNRRPPAPVPAP